MMITDFFIEYCHLKMFLVKHLNGFTTHRNYLDHHLYLPRIYFYGYDYRTQPITIPCSLYDNNFKSALIACLWSNDLEMDWLVNAYQFE